jgi:hypothetical protein
MSTATLAGSCLCGSIKFEVVPPFTAFRYCHCSRCQKASGSAHAANIFVPKAQFTWRAGEDLVKKYDMPTAQRFAVWFCPQCGSRVPHQVKGREDMLIPAGLLDNAPTDIPRPENGIFWGSRAKWYVAPGDMPCMNEYT